MENGLYYVVKRSKKKIKEENNMESWQIKLLITFIAVLFVFYNLYSGIFSIFSSTNNHVRKGGRSIWYSM